MKSRPIKSSAILIKDEMGDGAASLNVKTSGNTSKKSPPKLILRNNLFAKERNRYHRGVGKQILRKELNQISISSFENNGKPILVRCYKISKF